MLPSATSVTTSSCAVCGGANREGTTSQLGSAANARVRMHTTPAEAHARAHAAISDLSDDIELRRLRVRESGGHYFAEAVVAVRPGQAVIEGQGTADHIDAAVRRALPDSDVVGGA